MIRKLCLVMVVPLVFAACSSESTESDSVAGEGSLAVELSGPMGSLEWLPRLKTRHVLLPVRWE